MITRKQLEAMLTAVANTAALQREECGDLQFDVGVEEDGSIEIVGKASGCVTILRKKGKGFEVWER